MKRDRLDGRSRRTGRAKKTEGFRQERQTEQTEMGKTRPDKLADFMSPRGGAVRLQVC